MSRELRPHQVVMLDRLRSSLIAGFRRPMVQAPTGSGKTVLAGAIVKGARAKGKRVLFVVPAISLIDQTVRSFWAEGITDIGVIQGQHPMTRPEAPVQVASVQTLQRRAIPPFDVVLIDEAHRWFEMVGQWMADAGWQKVPFIGLSATPWTRGLGKHYDDLIQVTTTAELIEAGYLSPFRVYAPSHPDLGGVRTVAGDYHEGDLSEAMNKPALVADVVTTWRQRGENRPTFVFAVDRAHAKHLQGEFEKAGIGCGYIDAFTKPDEREAMFKRFSAGELRVIASVGCLTTGVDLDVRCIVLARPTRSEMLYCLDSETEVLTSHGWRGMGDVREGDCVATLADLATGEGQWSPVKAVVERDMAPTEAWVQYQSPRANFRVTDQHRMIFRGAHEKEPGYRIATAAEMLPVKGGVKVPTAVTIRQPGVPLTDAELYFIGMMMTDGTWTATAGSISQSERHPEIIERIEACLVGCGIGYTKSRVASPDEDATVQERHTRWRFDISAGKPKGHGNLGRGQVASKRTYREVAGVTGYRHLLPFLDKDFAPALMALSRSQFLTLLQGIHDGDGFKMKSPSVDWTPRSWTVCSARPLFAERLQALAAINGFTGHLRSELGSRKNPIWFLTVTPQDWRHMGGYASANKSPRPQIETKPATAERVWCVETETGTIVTRRRGKVTVVGNCQIIGRGLRTAKDHPVYGPKFDCTILDHSDTTLRLGFVTDIHHDVLDDGRERQKAEPRQKPEALPKECSACNFLKPAKTPKCPACGFKPERQSEIVCEDGQLVEMTPRRKKANADEKAFVFGQLKAYARSKGHKPGWAANKFRERFDVWPNACRDAPEIEPTPETLNWIKSRQIAFANRRKEPTYAAAAE